MGSLRHHRVCESCHGTGSLPSQPWCRDCDGDGQRDREATPADIVAYVAALPEAEAVALLMAVPQVRALVEAAQQASPSIEEIGAYSAALKPFKVPHE